jgi:hypothetical protein
MGKSSDKSLVVSVLLVCAVVAVGVAAYVKLAPADTVPVVVDTEVRPEGGGVKLLTPYYDDDGVLKYKTEEVNVPRDTDPHVYAVNKYLDLVSVVPEGAVLKSVKIENTIAVLDFSAEFASSYSTFDESTIVNGILTTMGQFPEVSYVKFMVEGKRLETLGNLDLIDPLEVQRIAPASSTGPGDTPSKS